MLKGERGRWRAYEVCEGWRSNLHEWASVYVVYLDGQLVYIGQTMNLFQRMFAHGIRLVGGQVITPWGTGKECVVKVSPFRRYGDWLMREARLIRRLQPRGNCKLVRAA
jgi:hypothetical protein